MAPPNDPLRLAEAWRALAGLDGEKGWRSTYLASIGSCRIMAARHMPDDREGLLLGFQDVRPPSPSELPAGRGFHVEIVREPALPRLVLIALARQPGAQLDLFGAMAQDLLSVIRVEESTHDAQVVMVRVVARIRAWQDFMLRERGGILSEEDEIGLHGELHVLTKLTESLQDAVAAVGAWEGPMRGLHDFVLPVGAIEVKSSVAVAGFRAAISSLDQLDPAVRSPLHLAAVRLRDDPVGLTLPERVAATREALSGSLAAASDFSHRLLRYGYIEAMAAHYTRRLKLDDMRLFNVADGFPALTARGVPRGVVSASYVIDLDVPGLTSATLPDVLQDARSP
ncbi:PD-(D/E)XK motif protein [Roseomonas sp. KE0001]|uniref:PD-(D/E)XK motif protein n=1 Tax=Roseomonas sp. KE0001 TaxID=2479201 RepID=UPI0018DF2D84|nr:PD-(D/E)XK motif protein [Roseomonas sp. KE0001]MBI0436073.1 PD-(D/E)XK motif protein [Roseomonas sp. KE0001]